MPKINILFFSVEENFKRGRSFQASSSLVFVFVKLIAVYNLITLNVS